MPQTSPRTVTLEPLEPRHLLSAGDVDTSFGRGGSTTVAGLAYFSDLAVQSTGKIVLLGYDGDPASPSSVAHLVRLNVDGSPDGSFHSQAPGFIALHVFLQSDNKVLVFGVNTTNGPVANLIRYNADGSVDNSFHNGAAVQTPLPNYADQVFRQPDGKILLANQRDVPSNEPGEHFNYEVTRLNADGTLDTAFGNHGEAVAAGAVGSPGALPPSAILLDKDGNIAVIGGVISSSGSVDSPYFVVFGPDGRATKNGGINVPFLSEARFGGGVVDNAGVVRPDDTPVITMSSSDDPSQPVYVATGTNHFLLLDPDPAATGVARQGNVINVGSNAVAVAGIEGREISVTRIAADGNPDPNYGFAGISAPLRIAPRGGTVGTVNITQAPGGAVVAAGTIYPTGSFKRPEIYVARFAGGTPTAVANRRGPAAALDPVPDFVTNFALGKRRLSFDVKYTASGGLDPATLDNHDVRVVGPHGFSALASFVGLANFQGANGQYAIYSVRGPGGHWNTADAGDYHVTLRSRQVRDTAGHPAPAGDVGHFTIPSFASASATFASPFSARRISSARDLFASPTFDF